MSQTTAKSSEGPHAGDPTFLFTELEGQDGKPPQSISFANARVDPLDFETLHAARLHKPLTIPLVWHGGTVVDTTIEGVVPGKSMKASATLESPYTSHAIGLVKGGWLPSAIAATYQQTTLLIDRNVATEIFGRFKNGRRVGREPDFLDLFEGQPIRINPMLFVLEGNRRSIPTAAEAEAQMREVEAKLRAALPDAEILAGMGPLKGTLGLIEDTRKSLGCQTQFLLMLAPAFVSPIARSRVGELWRKTLSAADLYGISRRSLLVLAVMSAAAVPNGGSPARRLLKFRNGYTQADAYNALADIRSLEIFIGVMSLYPDENIQLCTGDKDLALLWAGLRVSNIARKGRGFTYDMTPVEGLFPGDTNGAWPAALKE